MNTVTDMAVYSAHTRLMQGLAQYPTGSRDLYFNLASGHIDIETQEAATSYLEQQLTAAAFLPTTLPEQLHDIGPWIMKHTEMVGKQYRDYLAGRKNGDPRRYFSNKSHALFFIQNVAPTKLVDGSWLYGLLPYWNNLDLRPLIKTYLEELGNGLPEKNHVTLYRKLLATHGCEHWQDLSDEHFVQGAIQLALSRCAEHYLPEIIGYNLGYEQLPLHLLITAYELNELGIDPYYFTLHVTVDNADTGHAHDALLGLQQMLLSVEDKSEFFKRVATGLRLNDLGIDTLSVIDSFDLEDEVIAMLAAKSRIGKNMHSDFCRIAGRTVNEWLAVPSQMGNFLLALEQNGWIRRNEQPENSRFWRLIHGQQAEMFGVFTAYEQQLLADWIMTPGLDQDASGVHENVTSQRTPSYRARRRNLELLSSENSSTEKAYPTRQLIRNHRRREATEFDNELYQLETDLARAGREEGMKILINLMSPAMHHHPIGLMATRMFCKLYD